MLERLTRRHIVKAALLLPVAVYAPRMYVPADVQRIPLARVSANLQRAMRAEPRNPQWVHNLARAHAMAWSTRTQDVPIMTGYQPGFAPLRPGATDAARRRATDSTAQNATSVWFGHEPAVVPFTQVVDVTDSSRLRVARAHLDTALALYEAAIALDSTDLKIRLGQAWLLSQTPNRPRAIARLRGIVRDFPMDEQRASKNRSFGGHSVLAEAARYLIPMLNRTTDQAEIDRLQQQIREEERRPRAVTPIAIPLEDGASASDLENRAASVTFDADGTGLPKRWSWIRPNAAWLVHDPQHTGRITSALQLFGSVTFWMFWGNGYDALASLDDNRDGALRTELDGLALWHDANSNGVSERGEVRPIAAYGIIALSCTASRDATHPDRVFHATAGVTYRDGTTRPTYDFVLHERPARSMAPISSTPTNRTTQAAAYRSWNERSGKQRALQGS